MSNNPFKKKSKDKNVILRLDSFLITKETGAERNWVGVKSKDGFWSLRFRDDNPMYGKILKMAADEQYHVLLRHFINMSFSLTNIVPDGQFAKDFYVGLNAFVQRTIEHSKNPTEEEEKQAIEEQEVLYELQQELNDLTSEDEGTGNRDNNSGGNED